MTSSSSVRIPTLGQIKENLTKPVEEKTAQIVNPTQIAEPVGVQQSFTLDQLTTVWNTYAENLKSKGQINHHMVLTSTTLNLKPDFSIHITVGNPVQLDQLEEIKVELLSHLRQSLKNNTLRLNAVIGVIETKEKKFYTDADNFKFLAENYAVVADLKNKFGLEINY